MSYGRYAEFCNEYDIEQKYKDKGKYYFIYSFTDEDYEFGLRGIFADYDHDMITVETWISNHKNNDKKFGYVAVIQLNKEIGSSQTSKVLI